jgi:uncharacterized protein (DUF4415 family)
MSKVSEKWKLSAKARLIPKEQRRQYPPEAFEDRNTKVKITMYVDLDVLEYFKTRAAAGQPYQTQINAELRKIMEAEQSGGDAASNLRQAKGLIDAALRKIG